MSSDDTQTDPAECCQPGDVTVTKIPTGYLIGRAIEPIGPGPWWEYLGRVSRRDDALHHATTIARREGVRAWLHISGDDYEPIQD